MPNSAAMPMTVLPANDLENSFPDTVQEPVTDEAADNFDAKNGSVVEGSGARESMIPKIFPVYAFI